MFFPPGKLQYSSNSTINKSSVNRSKTLLSLCLSIDWEAEQREGFWINFSFPKGLQMKCQPSAPLHKRAFEQKEPKSLQYSGKPKVSYMCAKNTAKHSFSFMSEVSSNCLKSIVTEFINFQVNGEWRRHSPFACRKPDGASNARGSYSCFLVSIFSSRWRVSRPRTRCSQVFY